MNPLERAAARKLEARKKASRTFVDAVVRQIRGTCWTIAEEFEELGLSAETHVPRDVSLQGQSIVPVRGVRLLILGLGELEVGLNIVLAADGAAHVSLGATRTPEGFTVAQLEPVGLTLRDGAPAFPDLVADGAARSISVGARRWEASRAPHTDPLSQEEAHELVWHLLGLGLRLERLDPEAAGG